jgi:hypothetical protein
MINLTEATAAPAPATIGGETYQFSPLTNGDYGELSQWVKMRIIRTARASLTEDMMPDDREFTMDRAIVRATATDWYTTDGLAIVNSGDGLDYRIWLSVRRRHPQVTLARVQEWMSDPTIKLAILDAFNLARPVAKKNEAADSEEATTSHSTSAATSAS